MRPSQQKVRLYSGFSSTAFFDPQAIYQSDSRSGDSEVQDQP